MGLLWLPPWARTPTTVLAGILVLVTSAGADNEVFDARGFNPNRDFFSQLPFEHITLTGNLR